MKRLILISLLLTGCATTVPVKMSFPQAPEPILKPAEELQPLYTNEMNYEYHRERIRNLQISSVTDIILALSVIVILVFIGYYIFVVIHLKFN